jgi:hypothetical protein
VNLLNIDMQIFLKKPWFRFSLFSILLGLSVNFAKIVHAETAANAPQELKQVLTNLETVANQKNVSEIMKFYSDKFTNSDGLDYKTLSEGLKSIWSNYPDLKSSIELNSWEKKGDEIVTETTTYLKGSSRQKGRLIFLNSTLKSRQYWSYQKIVRQEILAEQTRLTTGLKPPNVKVNLPEKAKVGEQINLDLIVSEPLGEDVLLGGIVQEQTQANLYLNPSNFELEVLPAGGMFKLINAEKAGNEWLSAILVRADGITAITQRIRIEK